VNKKLFASSVFIATFLSAILTAILTGLEIGVSQAFESSGGALVKNKGTIE
jgi:hypothetical protein